MRIRKLVVIHFAPLEFYPPIQNLLQKLAEATGPWKVIVFTTQPALQLLRPFRLPSDRVKLVRIARSATTLGPLVRYWNYLVFFSWSLLLLIWHRPDRILYLETISSWPAYIYKRFFKTSCEILIHYHEYTTPEEYRNGMKLTRYFHQRERWLYPRATWVSQTNLFRMDRFKKDLSPDEIGNGQILPNYPPREWETTARQELALPLRIVYVGALSITTMYAEAFAGWVAGQQGKVSWDIYSFNLTSDVEDFLNNLGCPWIKLKGGVEYDQLPAILKEYDMGVILYTGHIPNYVYNAPNKLFEYLACGLRVLLPSVMLGSLPYCTETTYPEVIALDFESLDTIRAERFISAASKPLRQSGYFCDTALAPLVNKLTEF